MSEAISIENQKDPATKVLAKEGFKKTKLGWIPEEWSVKSLSEIGVFSKGKGISKSEITETGLPCIRYAEIYTKYNNYTYSFNSFINIKSAENSRTIESGEILFAGSGETLEDIGKCIAYLGKETVYAGGDIVVLKPKSENSKYLSFVLNNTVANKQKHKLGQGHSVVHIYSSSLKNIKIPLPPLPEQQKIAAILSTWDNAIGKQEQLIAAKQHYKKGLMQLLLTGEKRFPGFTEEWKEVKLEKILKIGSGRDYKHLDKGIVPVFGTGGYMLSVDKFLYDGETVFIGRKGTIDKPFYFNGKFWTVDTLFYTHSFNNSLPKFIYALFQKINWKKYNEASGVPSLSKTTIEKIKVIIPSLKEQQKIASTLSKVDQEIALLQNQLTQFQSQKRGLMQKLLTGAVRVKI